MRNKDFEEINDMLGDVIGGTSAQGLFLFASGNPDPTTLCCSELCFTNCDAVGSVSGSKQGTVTTTTDTPAQNPER